MEENTYRPYLWLGEEQDAHVLDYQDIEKSREYSQLLRGAQGGTPTYHMQMMALAAIQPRSIREQVVDGLNYVLVRSLPF